MNTFLKKFVTKDKNNITHTRIGDKNLAIFPGKYSIPDSELKEFYKIYYEHVFVKENKEFLTEVQNKNNNPILIDLDFRYDVKTKTRQHTSSHTFDIIELYINEINNITEIKSNIDIPVFVFEKECVNICEKYTKDGIHIIIGVSLQHVYQEILRENVLKKIHDILSDLPLINSYDNILDDGITKGHTNWQLFGSCKPNHQPYQIKKKYVFSFNTEDKKFDVNEEKIELSIELLNDVSARNTSYPVLDINSSVQLKEQNNTQKQQSKKTNVNLSDDITIISNKEELLSYFDRWYSELHHSEYYMKETHKLVMCLPPEYYNDFNKWIRVGWALHNCNKQMFLSWMLFSSQSDKFSYSDIIGYFEKWNSFQNQGLTERSIIYWAKKDNEEEYNKIHNESVDYMIEKSIEKVNNSEWDIAYVLFNYYKDEFRCGSLKKKEWYYFKKHRWIENESGYKIRYEMSNTLSRMYTKKSNDYGEMAIEKNIDGDKCDKMKTKAGLFSDIALKLKQTQYKQNVMKEASEIFFESDPNFMNRLDQNPYLMAFKNGVFDFEENEFRPGKPDDYISLNTHINYIPFNNKSKKQREIKEAIDNFMKQLFPKSELREYMWQHLASVLIGMNKPQTFNIYNGCGRNGKSKLIELMSRCLGDYMGIVPTSLVTEKRGGVGSLSPEVAQLKGKRYAVMQEPSKGDSLNDGVMKSLTGQDPIQANPKYKDPITFIPQFKLVVCTNNKFDIKSNDDGTWRRIRLCEFISKFVPNPKEDEYEFHIDYEIEKKFDEWKTVFMALLVDIAVKTSGNVNDTDIVLSASNEYRKEQDYLLQFVEEKLYKRDKLSRVDEKIKINSLWQEFQLWYKDNHNKSLPKKKELTMFLEKEYGKKWQQLLSFKEEDDDEELIGMC